MTDQTPAVGDANKQSDKPGRDVETLAACCSLLATFAALEPTSVSISALVPPSVSIAASLPMVAAKDQQPEREYHQFFIPETIVLPPWPTTAIAAAKMEAVIALAVKAEAAKLAASAVDAVSRQQISIIGAPVHREVSTIRTDTTSDSTVIVHVLLDSLLASIFDNEAPNHRAVPCSAILIDDSEPDRFLYSPCSPVPVFPRSTVSVKDFSATTTISDDSSLAERGESYTLAPLLTSRPSAIIDRLDCSLSGYSITSVQMRITQQRGNGSCGYYALHNAISYALLITASSLAEARNQVLALENRVYFWR